MQIQQQQSSGPSEQIDTVYYDFDMTNIHNSGDNMPSLIEEMSLAMKTNFSYHMMMLLSILIVIIKLT